MTYLTGLDGVLNFRDLGNLPLPGGVTRPGVVYRSAAPGSITGAGLASLSASNLGAIADLRTDDERRAHPNRLPADNEIHTENLPIYAGSLSPEALKRPAADEATADLIAKIQDGYIPAFGELYSLMLKQGHKQLTTAAQLVVRSAAAGQSVLVHCTAGKDRTGIASALILDAVGVKRPAIIDHYVLSESQLAGPWVDQVLKQLDARRLLPNPRVIALATTSPASAIEAALAWIDEHYDGSAGYLKAGGMTERKIDDLRGALT